MGRRYQAYPETGGIARHWMSRHKKPSFLPRTLVSGVGRRSGKRDGLDQHESWAFQIKTELLLDRAEVDELRSPFCPVGAEYARQNPRDRASASFGPQDTKKHVALQSGE